MVSKGEVTRHARAEMTSRREGHTDWLKKKKKDRQTMGSPSDTKREATSVTKTERKVESEKEKRGGKEKSQRIKKWTKGRER